MQACQTGVRSAHRSPTRAAARGGQPRSLDAQVIGGQRQQTAVFVSPRVVQRQTNPTTFERRDAAAQAPGCGRWPSPAYCWRSSSGTCRCSLCSAASCVAPVAVLGQRVSASPHDDQQRRLTNPLPAFQQRFQKAIQQRHLSGVGPDPPLDDVRVDLGGHRPWAGPRQSAAADHPRRETGRETPAAHPTRHSCPGCGSRSGRPDLLRALSTRRPSSVPTGSARAESAGTSGRVCGDQFRAIETCA